MGFTRLQPIDWPQDHLRVPDGFGSMPPLNKGNLGIGSEFFALSGTFAWVGGTAAGSIRNQVMPTPQDGDFRCNQVKVVSWEKDETLAASDTQGFLASVVTIRDIRTGRSMVYAPPFIPAGGVSPTFAANAVPINLFRTLPQSGTEVGQAYDGSTPAPSGFRTTGFLDQPYCFTRQGGIEVSITNLFAAPANVGFQVTLSFNGWKDYGRASR